MPNLLRVILVLVVTASATVMALPRSQLAPLGVTSPPPPLVAAAVAAVGLLLGVLLCRKLTIAHNP